MEPKPVSAPGPDPVHAYRVGNLGIRSALPLPDLAPDTDAAGSIGLTVACDRSPASGPDAIEGGEPPGGRCRSTDAVSWNIPGIGHFQLDLPDRAVIRATDTATPDDLAMFFMATVLPFWAALQGWAPLQGVAVEHRGEAIVFRGEAGIGLSTLAAACIQRGCRVLADGICLIAPGASGRPPSVLPTARSLILRPDSLRALGLPEPAAEGRIGLGALSYRVPFPAATAPSVPVAGIDLILGRGGSPLPDLPLAPPTVRLTRLAEAVSQARLLKEANRFGPAFKVLGPLTTTIPQQVIWSSRQYADLPALLDRVFATRDHAEKAPEP